MTHSIQRVEHVLEGFGGKDDQTNGITNLQEYLTNLKNELIEMIKNSASSVPTGLIAMFSGTTPPDGWAFCDGMSGRPNLLGRFVVGYDPSNQDYNTIGNMGGEALVTLTLDQIPPHSHKITFKEEKWGDNANNRPFPNHTRPDSGYTADTQVTGGGSPHENRPPYFVLAYIIKL
jgi:microcystin-dependent protein